MDFSSIPDLNVHHNIKKTITLSLIKGSFRSPLRPSNVTSENLPKPDVHNQSKMSNKSNKHPMSRVCIARPLDFQIIWTQTNLIPESGHDY